jgi:hypothetical protein
VCEAEYGRFGPDPEVLASSIDVSFPGRELPSRLEKETTLQVEVKGRFGVIPNFFRLTPEHAEITDYLWRFACIAYLDNPLPSLFKERLFSVLRGPLLHFATSRVFGWAGSRLR